VRAALEVVRSADGKTSVKPSTPAPSSNMPLTVEALSSGKKP
jgi:hypothetical protein